MAYIGNEPLLALALNPTDGVAFAGQNYIPIPGGVIPGLNLVWVGGAKLSPGDFSDADGMGIALAVPMAAGTQFSVATFTANTSFVPVSGQLAGGRNKIINGNFDIWQRGAAIGAAQGVLFGADRWMIESNLDGGSYLSGAGFGRNSFTLGQTAVPGEPTYYATVKGSVTGGGASAYWTVGYKIEGVRNFAGSKATFSVWLDCSVARTAVIQWQQNFGTGGSPSTAVRFGTQTITLNGGNGSQWKRYEITVDVPSIAGKTLGSNGNDWIGFYIWMQAGATVGASTGVGTITDPSPGSTLYIARAQMESGSVATAFEDVEIGETLRRCQRYCLLVGREASGTLALGGYCTGSQAFATIYTPVSMRTVPTWEGGTLRLVTSAGIANVSAILKGDSANAIILNANQTNTSGHSAYLESTNTTGFRGFTAEL